MQHQLSQLAAAGSRIAIRIKISSKSEGCHPLRPNTLPNHGNAYLQADSACCQNTRAAAADAPLMSRAALGVTAGLIACACRLCSCLCSRCDRCDVQAVARLLDPDADWRWEGGGCQVARLAWGASLSAASMGLVPSYWHLRHKARRQSTSGYKLPESCGQAVQQVHFRITTSACPAGVPEQ